MSHAQGIDWDKTLLLIEASILAYRVFDVAPTPPEPPPGYEIVDTWTGVDSLFGMDRTTEIYGVVLRATTSPHRYVFAFRGTASVMDVLDDMGVEKKPFTPFDKTVTVPEAVAVESGFVDVYSLSSETTKSMQEQVFALLDRYAASEYPVAELWITGHSLGSSLSELFTLDVALSRPTIRASNINFACPRVGNAEFVEFYGQQAAQQDPTTRTLRVQNVFDRVPCVPPESMGYQHVPSRFLIAFYKDARWHIDPNFIIDNHASAHYQAVLQCANASADKLCLCESLPVAGEDYTLTSEKPDPSDVCKLF